MFPWYWLWAPQLYFPWSGSVNQDISPDTNWFFAGIPPKAGDGQLEKKIFDEASYGQQLGVISEVLLSIAAQDTVDTEKAKASLEQLKALYKHIEEVKQEHREKKAEEMIDELRKLKARNPAQFDRVLVAVEAKGL